MPAVKLSPLFNGQTVSGDGPASGYKVNAYAAGSSERLTMYTSSAGTVAQSNPVILDSNGYPGSPIWLQTGLAYKFVLTDADDNVVKTFDNISGVNDASLAVDEWQVSGLTPTYISTTSFSVPGDQTSEFHVGRRLQMTTSGGTRYGTISTSAYTTLTTVTVVLDSGTLDAGLSVVNLSILRADSPSLPNSAAARAALGIVPEPYIYLRDEKASNTAGGTSVAASYQTRTLNTEVMDTGNNCTLTSNQILLAAGTYRFFARAPALNAGGHRLRLRNVSAGISYLGPSGYTTSSSASVCDATVRGKITVTAGQVLELHHYTQLAQATTGLGTPNATGEVEIYAEIEFWKES
jgi:hypothetical protein